MISLTVQVRDTASPAMKDALAKLTNRQPLLKALGKGLESDLKAHFLVKNSRGNKRGWPTQNFWNRIRNATAFTGATNDTSTVTIADPAINPHYYGGVIKPKKAKFNAIPARSEAYGVMPSSGLIPGLRFVPTRTGGMLVQAAHSTFKLVKDRRKGLEGQRRVKQTGAVEGGGVFYWLKRFVTIPKDPDALPKLEVLQDRLMERAAAWLQRNVLGAKL
jgi:hypothetical protein